jgi:hypothetical protein
MSIVLLISLVIIDVAFLVFAFMQIDFYLKKKAEKSMLDEHLKDLYEINDKLKLIIAINNKQQLEI